MHLEKALRLNHTKTLRQLFEMQSEIDELKDRERARHRKIKTLMLEMHSDIEEHQRQMIARQDQIINIALSQHHWEHAELPETVRTRHLWKSRMPSTRSFMRHRKKCKAMKSAALAGEAETVTTKAKASNASEGSGAMVWL